MNKENDEKKQPPLPNGNLPKAQELDQETVLLLNLNKTNGLRRKGYDCLTRIIFNTNIFTPF